VLELHVQVIDTRSAILAPAYVVDACCFLVACKLFDDVMLSCATKNVDKVKAMRVMSEGHGLQHEGSKSLIQRA
jgi:hypothetical protein